MALPLSLQDAARRLPSARRLLVIGCSGSGKSTLARALAARLGLRHVPMDRDIFWLPGWTARPRDEAQKRLTAIVAEENWVIDGTSPGTLSLRLPRADLVIWLRPSRWVSLRGIIGRRLKYHGRTRPDMADNCPEKIDLEFLTYVWNFEKTESPEIESALSAHGAETPLLILRSRREADQLLNRLARHLAGKSA